MKKKLYLLLLTAICCFVLSACGDDDIAADIATYEYEGNAETDVFTIENDKLSLTVSGASTHVTIVDKATGTVYSSNPSEEDVNKYSLDEGLYKNLLKSTLAISYSDSKDSEKEINNLDCITNRSYSIVKNGNDEIVVNYSVGEFEKDYILPVVIKADKMQTYLDQMSSMEKRKVLRSYYNWNYEELTAAIEDENNNEETKAYHQEMLSKAERTIPDIQDGPVYYLMDTKENNKDRLEPLEVIFEKYGYTIEDKRADMEGYDVSRNAGKAVFNVSVHYKLDGDQLVVSVPFKEISYNENFPITKLQVLPYMGAGNPDEEGYIIVPEAGGGMINFNNGKTGQQAYISDMYGWDYGLTRDSVVSETNSSYPVIAIANKTKNSSMVCIAEEGSSYATVRADVAGKKDSYYNYGSFDYQMVHGENMDVSGKSDNAVRVFEESLPDETISQRYIFTTATDYSSLAIEYREYLLAQYKDVLKKKENVTSVPFAVEMIGAVDDTEHILGYPVVRSQALTTYEQAQTILKGLKEEVGIADIYAKYTGWFNTGVKQTSAAEVSTVGRLGSSSDLEALVEYTNATDGTELFLNGTFSFVYKDKWFDGFSVRSDSAEFVSREECELYTYDAVTFQSNEDHQEYLTFDTYYLVKPAYMKDSINSYVETIKEYGANNVGFEDVGNKLSGDYNPSDRYSREASMKMQAEVLKNLKASNKKVMISAGNQYAAPYADYVTDMNIAGKASNIIDEQIPFYQIALHGLVNYSGAAMNLSADMEENMLKSAESGAGLFYAFIYANTDVLQDGKYTRYYACNYNDWKEDAKAMYEKFNAALGDTYNQYITEHKKLDEGVYATTYENGKTVVVNYNYASWTDTEGVVLGAGENVPARDFVATKGGE